jgi:hypothetical protein
MGEKIRRLVQQQWAGLIALFLVLSGGTAWATHERILSSDIVDGEVKNVDLGANAVTTGKVQNETLLGQDIAPNIIGSGRIADNSLTGADVANTNSLGSPEIGGLGSADITNNSLTGDDIDENSLLNVNATTVAGGKACRTNNVLSTDPAGPTPDLCVSGPLTMFPRCTDIDENFIRAEIVINTNEDHSFYGGTTVDADFEAADPPATLLKAEDKSGDEASAAMHEVIAGAEGGVGGQIAGVAAVRAERGEPGSDCQFVFYGAG